MKRLLYVTPALALILAFSLPFSPKGIAGIALTLGGLIFFHELGHFLAAKRMKMPVEVFSLGFGPRLIGFQWRETDVRLSALPLGGYVKLAGYNPEDPNAEDPHGFLQQPYGKRMLFYAGGILANMLVAFLLLWAGEIDQARIISWKTQGIQSQKPLKNGAAARGGLKEGDFILEVGELKYPKTTWEETVTYIQARPDATIPFKVRRGNQELTLNLVTENAGGKGRLGLPAFLRLEVPDVVRPLAFRDIGKGFVEGAKGTAYRTVAIAFGFWQLITFQADMSQVGGPGAIGAMAYQAAKAGWWHLVSFMAFLSINLAVLNALPIPFLDGGHMAILSFEKLRRKDLSIEVKERILTGGFFFLITLMALVIAMDLWRLKN